MKQLHMQVCPEPETNCADIYYKIISNNCGTCPSSTNSTTASCTGVVVNETAITCSFAAQTVGYGCLRCNESVSNNTEVILQGKLHLPLLYYIIRTSCFFLY